jgi:hypothetical protein
MKVTTAPAGRNGQASRSPGDEIGPYTDTQLRKMDDAFVAAVTVAFATGKESPQVACATVQAAPRGVGRESHHSITSSATASSPGGKLRPNALAVLRLITSSNLVACMTGRSAGFSPLRMRPVYRPAWRYPSVMLVP